MQSSFAQEKLWRGLRYALAYGLIAVAALVLGLTPLGGQLWELATDPTAERVSTILPVSRIWMPLALIGLMILHTLLPLPAEFLALAAGMVLGPVWGIVTIWVGAMLGAYLGFFLARTLGQPVLRRLAASPRMQHVQQRLQHADIPILLAVRLLPIISFNLINYALGLTPIGWWRFTWTTGVGIVPVTVFVVIFGAHLDDWRVLGLMLVLAVVVAVAAYWVMRHSGARLTRQ